MRTIAIAVGLALVAPPAVAAAYMKLGDIKGETSSAAGRHKDHKGEIEILSFEWLGEHAAGLPTGKRQHKPISVTRPIEKGRVHVRGVVPGCATGTHFPTASLRTEKARWELKDVVISDCTADGAVFSYGGVREAPSRAATD